MTAPALAPVLVLQATWTDCPADVKDEVRKLWHEEHLGNDVYIYKWSDGDPDCRDDSKDYPVIAKYLHDHNVAPGTEVWIHFWW